MQFEGGLYATALVVDGAYKLAEKAKKAPTIAEVTVHAVVAVSLKWAAAR